MRSLLEMPAHLLIFRIGLRLDERYFARVGGGRMLLRDGTTGNLVADPTGRAALEAFGPW
jgi:hypothetical protein